jgi:hypothetical protein
MQDEPFTTEDGIPIEVTLRSRIVVHGSPRGSPCRTSRRLPPLRSLRRASPSASTPCSSALSETLARRRPGESSPCCRVSIRNACSGPPATRILSSSPVTPDRRCGLGPRRSGGKGNALTGLARKQRSRYRRYKTHIRRNLNEASRTYSAFVPAGRGDLDGRR